MSVPMDVVSIEIYGRPSDMVLEMMKRIVESGIALSIKSEPVDGYIRTKGG